MKCTCGLTYSNTHPWTTCLYGQIAKRFYELSHGKKIEMSNKPKKLTAKDMTFPLKFIGEDPNNYKDELKDL